MINESNFSAEVSIAVHPCHKHFKTKQKIETIRNMHNSTKKCKAILQTNERRLKIVYHNFFLCHQSRKIIADLNFFKVVFVCKIMLTRPQTEGQHPFEKVICFRTC